MLIGACSVIVKPMDRFTALIVIVTFFLITVSAVQVGMVKIADTSWLTPRPVNPLNVGQIVNNANKENAANVRYQEEDIPESFPIMLKKFIPNVNYGNESKERTRLVYLQVTSTINSVAEWQMLQVILQAIRDIKKGEELFSSYFTVI